MTFRVTQKIVNGVEINNRELVQMLDRLGNLTTAFSNTPMVKVNIASAMLFVPDKCVINEGLQIDVNFGENSGVDINFGNVGVNKVDGVNYARDFTLRYICEGVSLDKV